jgi:hypothetical protein
MGADAGVPVILGARTIGAGVASTAAAGGLVSPAGAGGGGSIGAHAASQSGAAISIATDQANQIRPTARPGSFRGATALSSQLSIGVSPGVISPQDYALPRAQGIIRERHTSNERVATTARPRQCRGLGGALSETPPRSQSP